MRAAAAQATVLLLGESGSGKEVLARFIHGRSARASGPFVAVNCASLSTRTLAADVRIVAATHRDLGKAIREGRFREDLFYRINVLTLRVPPLRERPADIAPLLDHFLARHSREAKRPVLGITRDARELLLRYTWPGNVRELSNVVERMVVLAQGDELDVEDLPEEVRDCRDPLGASSAAANSPSSPPHSPLPSYHDAVREAKRRILRDALERADNVQTHAARLLGLTQPYMARLTKNLDVRRKT